MGAAGGGAETPIRGWVCAHVGWNSVLEAVVAGVPMVAWPLHAEQHLNKAVLVENMKMAIGVEQRDGDRFVSGAELERRLKELMDSKEGRELRERSEKIREMAVEAWRGGIIHYCPCQVGRDLEA
ncbi:hypothetical protein PVL29_011376 [Vitis rotundifolia]|uniref:Uncharacterized protein n=1 Tax=Vitis rotundifolia TaxID=103349 RepID=A0AA39DQC8_VITRO|nr:hypothetical protein PVL29_011376 [Vitis rotundifolia]